MANLQERTRIYYIERGTNMSNQLNNRRLMNDGWSFSKHQLGATLSQVLDEKTVWLPVDLPHDWLIYNMRPGKVGIEGRYQWSN